MKWSQNCEPLSTRLSSGYFIKSVISSLPNQAIKYNAYCEKSRIQQTQSGLLAGSSVLCWTVLTLEVTWILYISYRMVHGGCVYIMVNLRHTVFYTGVTSDLVARISEHKNKIYPNSFTCRYNITKLVYYESFYSIEEAIEREKQIKKYSRFKKVRLVISQNPEWRDLYEEISRW